MDSNVILAYGAIVCAGLLAVASALRARRSLARWAFTAGMAALGCEAAAFRGTLAATAASEAAGWQAWKLIAAGEVAVAWVAFSLRFARCAPRRPGRFLGAWLGATIGVPLVLWLGREELLQGAGSTLVRGQWSMRLEWLGIAENIALLGAAVAIAVNLERTFRAAVGTIRWRIKFALLGAGVLFVARIYTVAEVLLFRGLDLRLEAIECVALLVAAPLFIWSYFRAGHLEMDVYPSGSTLHHSLAILAAGAYLVVVGLLAKIVTLFGGDAAFGLKAFLILIAVVVLVIGLQSDRLHTHLRRFVSRHFQRPLHDYRDVWRKLTEATAAQVAQPELCRALTAVVGEVFQALSVRIWLLNGRRELLILAASTTSPIPPGHEPKTDAEPILALFPSGADPIDLDLSVAPAAALLRTLHPADFEHGGHRFAVALPGRGQPLGVMTIGDRVAGVPFSTQDLELLRCMAEHAGAALLNVQLAESLSEAKQLEAFQTMATFFVHDLKNAAATLKLTLENLPVHFADPEFRADALRGLAKSADHINRLIGRLTALRHELTIKLADADINEVVTQALSNLGAAKPPTLINDMQPLPRIPVDREQLYKVVLNLLLNASEAVSANGRIRVSTRQQPGWVVLTVDDNGCGMTEEFVAQSLFRPFHTTKKSGLGIGMFQSKMIVEAHGGRITVASEPGNGTRFQVFLRGPLAA